MMDNRTPTEIELIEGVSDGLLQKNRAIVWIASKLIYTYIHSSQELN